MFRLTSSTPYLLNRLGMRMGSLFMRRLAPYGLTVPMFRVLASLVEKPDQKLSELSGTTSTEISTMSRMIGVMIDKRLVSRVRLPNDERTVQINLTDEGRQLAAELMVKAQHYEDVVVQALDEIDVDGFKNDLVRIYHALDILEGELRAEAAEVAAKRPAK